MSRYSKSIVAVLGFLSTWAATYYPDDVEVQKWLGLAVGAITAALVYSVPNRRDGEPVDPYVSDPGAARVGPTLAVALVLAAIVVAVLGYTVAAIVLAGLGVAVAVLA